jgi:DnaJ domain
MRYTYRSEWVRCGKKCSGCPHGPYWYRYFREEGKLKKEYIGRERTDLPDPPALPDWREPMRSDRTATPGLAYRILGLQSSAGQAKVKARYRELAFANHPDRGGDSTDMSYINLAYSYLMRFLR